jgi:hypothetical protein
VQPLGIAVDTEDPSAPDHYAIYVLDNTDPQALNSLDGSASVFEGLSLSYRIQKLDDQGHVLGSTAFTLTSTAAQPALHAVALAVDGPADRVYVLIEDVPGGESENPHGRSAADRIDAWTTGRNGAPLLPAVGLSPDMLPDDSITGAGGGELAGPSVLQQGTPREGDINAVSIAVDGTGAAADLALAGQIYGPGGGLAVERLLTQEKGGDPAGTVDGSQWRDASATEDEAAKSVGQTSQVLNSMSTNPDGSLNLTLGREIFGQEFADDEPNMASVSADLQQTTPILPWADAKESAAARNYDRAATDGFSQVMDLQSNYKVLTEGGATDADGAGTLAPSVVELQGDGSSFPSGLYAGIVANSGGGGNDPASGAPFSWEFYVPGASFGIRVFDGHEHSLAFLGGGPCKLRGGPIEDHYEGGSFAALAAGRNGTVFALTQADLRTQPGETIDPEAARGAGSGDEVVEFAPGAGQSGAPGEECPQPSGGFSITNKTVASSTPSTGTGPVTIPVGTEVEFNAGEVNLQGGAPWSYDWNLEGAEETLGGPLPAGVFENSWHIVGANWKWALPTQAYKYTKPGSYPATLKLVNDFGTLTAQRTVEVVEEKPCTAAFTVSPGAVAGQVVSLEASGSTCEGKGDQIKAYHWEFGDSQPSESTPGPAEQHVYAEAGSYTVKLQITDSLGRQFTAEPQTVSVVAPSTGGGGGGGGNTGGNPGPSTPPSGGGSHPPTTSTGPKPLTNAQKLAQALKVCKKKAKKQRAVCEKQARAKYSPKAKTKKKKKR